MFTFLHEISIFNIETFNVYFVWKTLDYVNVSKWLHLIRQRKLKFIYSEKATKFYEIFPLLLTTVHTVKSKEKISQNFVAFSEYMNFTTDQAASKQLLIPFNKFTLG